jgi:hypothetical protein
MAFVVDVKVPTERYAALLLPAAVIATPVLAVSKLLLDKVNTWQWVSSAVLYS